MSSIVLLRVFTYALEPMILIYYIDECKNLSACFCLQMKNTKHTTVIFGKMIMHCTHIFQRRLGSSHSGHSQDSDTPKLILASIEFADMQGL